MDVTYNFTAGTRAVAQQVNQNFADVKSAVDPLQTEVASIQEQLTSGIILPDGSVDFTRLQSYKTYTVSNATNATPIVVTAVGHSFLTGDKVYISGVGGNTAANGIFTITKTGTDTFQLDGSVGNGAFSSNGTAVIYPSADDNLINKVYVDNENLKNITQIGTCSTASATAEKAVTLSGFVLAKGATIQVKFTNANTATTPTLNVNGTGAKAIYNEAGVAVGATYPAYFPAGSTIEFIYDGTNWIFHRGIVGTYANNQSMVRVYSDGYVEQGDICKLTTNPITITLPRTLINNPINISLTSVWNETGMSKDTLLATTTNSTIQVYRQDANTNFYWRVGGY